MYSQFAEFYSEVNTLITAIDGLSNTYGSFRRVPLGRLKPYHEKLYMLYKDNISLYKNIYAAYKDIPEAGAIRRDHIRDMLIVFNSIYILLTYFGYDLQSPIISASFWVKK